MNKQQTAFVQACDVFVCASFDELLAMGTDNACPIYEVLCPPHLKTENFKLREDQYA
jgi:hypothetical protein